MHPTLTATSAKQSSGLSTTTTTTTGYAFLSAPPKPKNRPQPITTRCSPPRSLTRTTPRRRSSISSPVFQTTFVVPVSTPTSATPKTPHLTNYGYTAAFATFPRRGSVSHVQEVQCHQARRAPVSPKRLSPRSAPSSPKRGHSSGSPKRRHHRSPSSPFAPPSPIRTRARAESTTRAPLPIPPTPSLPRTPKLSKIRSLTNLRSRSSSSAPAPRATAPKPTMDIHTPTTTKFTSKRTKRSATPARGSAAYAKYRPMPFIQQMQMIQFLEGGSLDSHIRRHHVHAGQGTAHTGFATNGNEDVAHGYSFTDERGMVWFDEEEEWEFTCLLPRTRTHRRRGGFKRFLGKRRDEESSDEWEDFVQEEEEAEDLEEDMDPEALIAREEDALRAREDDLASFGGALEGTWSRGHPGQSVLKLPETKAERKRREHKRVAGIGSSAPARVTTTTRAPREQISALKDEFFATAFTPPSTIRPSESSSQRSRAASPFRMFTRATTSMDDNATTRPFFHRHKNPSVGSQSFASMGGSLRGGDVLDAIETVSVPPSPTVQWATREEPRVLNVSSAVETCRRMPSLPQNQNQNPESRVRCVSPPPAAARRLGIEPSTAVSLHPLPVESMKKKMKGVRGFKSTKGNYT